MQNITVADLVQNTLATLAFALFLLTPGYLLGMASNFFGMRGRSGAEKLLFSVAFSVATTPIITVLLMRFFSYPVTFAFFLLLTLISIGTLVRQCSRFPALFAHMQRSTWLVLGLSLAWFMVVQLSLADLQIGHHLYVNYVVYDHSLRVPFVEAVVRTGVPPHNPFYGLGQAPVLRYFYYWYVVCALPVKLFGLPAKACLDASIFWSGLGLAALIPLFLKYFFAEREGLRAKSLIGISLLSVTGLDLLAYAVWSAHHHYFFPDLEWWDNNQITSWVGSLLWVPHHVASLTACMAGLLALSIIDEETPVRQASWAGMLAGIAFASAAGLSIYVVFPFAIVLVIWVLLTLAKKRFRSFVAYLGAGILSLLLSWPYLLDLLSKSITGAGDAPGASVGSFAFFAIRDFRPGLKMLTALGVHSFWLTEAAKLPMLVLVYAIEFGFYALALLFYWRREPQNSSHSRQRRMAWLLFVVCLTVLSFMKSNTSGANDLGFRGMLSVQFVLLLWAAPVVYEAFSRAYAAHAGSAGRPRKARWVKASLVCTLALGFAGTIVQLVLLRSYAPLADTGRLTRCDEALGAIDFGSRTYWLHQVYSRLDGLTSPGELVQYNPIRNEVLIAHTYSTRQAAVGDFSCGSVFGGDSARCRESIPVFLALFNSPDEVRDWDIDRFCNDYNIDVLVATDADPIWGDPESWVWRRPALVVSPMVRAIPCGARASAAN